MSRSPAHRILTAIWLVVSLSLFGCAKNLTPAVPALLTGTVSNRQGAPIRGGIVVVEGQDRPGALTDSAGRFIIRGVPPGRHAIRAQFLAHGDDMVVVHLEPADSIKLHFRLDESVVEIAGSGVPLPVGPDLQAARSLLEGVLLDPAMIRLLRDPVVTANDSVIVWAAWIEPEIVVLRGRPRIVLVKDCGACVRRRSWGVEGASLYTAALNHVNLGVTRGRAGPRQLQFCIGIATSGTTLEENCGSTEKFASITYVQQSDGSWLRRDE